MNLNIKDIINIDPEILHGTPVFKGTRVPVQSLFWHIEEGATVDEFLEDFPTVLKEQCISVMELAAKSFSEQKFIRLYENAA
jgi:uncharacterized protein (DUF433 family)